MRAAMFFKQRISIAIQTANFACILGTMREVESLEELFLYYITPSFT